LSKMRSARLLREYAHPHTKRSSGALCSLCLEHLRGAMRFYEGNQARFST
jgi:hypothetical protein